MTERRFNEAEVAAIFEKAAEAHHTGSRRLPSGEGMTLAELQAIGSEVGIDPRLVAHDWPRLRRRQMEEIAGRLTPVAELPPASDS